MYMEERIDFINSLPTLALPAQRSMFSSKPRPKLTHSVAKASASVFFDTITARVPGVSKQILDDVNLCKLIMRHAADKKFPADEQLYEWYQYYTNGLGNLGWVLQTKDIDTKVIQEVGLTIDNLSQKLSNALIGDKADVIAACSKQAVMLANNTPEALEAFHSKREAKKKGKFDLGSVWLDDRGQPTMLVNCVIIESREHITDVLSWKSTERSTTVKSGAVLTYLDNTIFSKIRGTLVEKYDSSAKKYIQDLPDFDI